MRIYRIDHVGQLVADLDEQVERLEKLFGFRTTRRWVNPDEGCRGARLAIPGASAQAWEVLAPAGADSALQRDLEARGGRPGFHHVAVEVPDLALARAELERLGVGVTQGEGWLEATLSPPEGPTGVPFRLRGPGGLALCGDVEAVAPAAPEAAPPRRDGTLGILGLDHVCQAYPERDVLARWYSELAGFVEVWRTPIDAHADMADLVLNIPGSSICWEVIMPRGEDSFIDRFLARNGAAAHHVTFEVADWERALDACRRHGTPTFDEEEGVTDGARWRHTFIHPRYSGGVLVQLFWEERPGVWVRSDKIAPGG